MLDHRARDASQRSAPTGKTRVRSRILDERTAATFEERGRLTIGFLTQTLFYTLNILWSGEPSSKYE